MRPTQVSPSPLILRKYSRPDTPTPPSLMSACLPAAAAAALAAGGLVPAPLDSSPEAITARLATPTAGYLASALASVDDDGVKVREGEG